MKIAGIKILYEFKQKHAASRGPLNAWLKEVETAEWQSFHDVKQRYPSASNIGRNVVIFNIKANDYRLETKIDYVTQVVLIKRIGTHSEYNRW